MKIKLFVYFLLVVFVAACSNPFFPPLKPKGITLSIPDTGSGVDIGSIIVGETPDPFEVTITNNGKNPTGDITITLSGDDADKFTIVPDTLDSIDPGDSDSFKIIPDDGLPEGEYKATVTIECEDGTKIEFEIIFVVNPPPCTHTYRWKVTSTTYPASSTETCILCNETRGSSRATQIGDIGPAGGFIFHIIPGGFTVQGYSGGPTHLNFASYTAYYLEVAPANESNAQWGAYGTLISGVTTFTSTGAEEASIIGNGRKDTYTIATYLNNNTSETNRAAQLCVNKSLNSFSDWFLPSLGELNQLYLNRVAVNEAGGSLGTNWFWSSSQSVSSNAWLQNFTSGSRGNVDKINTPNVRAVRAF